MARADHVLDFLEDLNLNEEMDADDYTGEFEEILKDIKKEKNPKLCKEAEDIIHKNLGKRVNIEKDSPGDIAGDMVQSEPRSWSRTLSQLKNIH